MSHGKHHKKRSGTSVISGLIGKDPLDKQAGGTYTDPANEPTAPPGDEAGREAPMIERNEGNSPTPPFTAVVFETEDEYVRFTDYVYERFGGQGLDFTDVPVRYSVCVTPELLAKTQEGFALRPVTDADIAQALKHVKGRRPFDPEDLDLE